MLISFFLAKAETMNTKIIVPTLNHRGFRKGLAVSSPLKTFNITTRLTHKPNATSEVIIHKTIENVRRVPLISLWPRKKEDEGKFFLICSPLEIKISVPKNPKSNVPRLNRIGDLKAQLSPWNLFNKP